MREEYVRRGNLWLPRNMGRIISLTAKDIEMGMVKAKPEEVEVYPERLKIKESARHLAG